MLANKKIKEIFTLKRIFLFFINFFSFFPQTHTAAHYLKEIRSLLLTPALPSYMISYYLCVMLLISFADLLMCVTHMRRSGKRIKSMKIEEIGDLKAEILENNFQKILPKEEISFNIKAVENLHT
jgi:hypothetical protein